MSIYDVAARETYNRIRHYLVEKCYDGGRGMTKAEAIETVDKMLAGFTLLPPDDVDYSAVHDPVYVEDETVAEDEVPAPTPALHLVDTYKPRPPMYKVNLGHGHVYPRPDGHVMRCGGPAICSTCAIALADALRSGYDVSHLTGGEYRTVHQTTADRNE